jgi:rubredoxin
MRKLKIITIKVEGIKYPPEVVKGLRNYRPGNHPPHPICPVCGYAIYKRLPDEASPRPPNLPWRYCRNSRCPLYKIDLSRAEYPLYVAVQEKLYREGIDHREIMEKQRRRNRLAKSKESDYK